MLPGEFDRLEIAGDAALDGQLIVELMTGFTPLVGDEFEIIDVGGALSGRFIGLDEGALIDAGTGTPLRITYAGGDGANVVLTAVPEPSTLCLLSLALLLTPCARPLARGGRRPR